MDGMTGGVYRRRGNSSFQLGIGINRGGGVKMCYGMAYAHASAAAAFDK